MEVPLTGNRALSLVAIILTFLSEKFFGVGILPDYREVLV
jgi:hypothetical protein